MARVNDPIAAMSERDEYFEELQIVREEQALSRDHEVRMAKLKQGRALRYKTWERAVITLFKIVPYCIALTGVIILTLVKRDIPESLEKFLAS